MKQALALRLREYGFSDYSEEIAPDDNSYRSLVEPEDRGCRLVKLGGVTMVVTNDGEVFVRPSTEVTTEEGFEADVQEFVHHVFPNEPSAARRGAPGSPWNFF